MGFDMRQCVCRIRWAGDRLACGWSLGVQSAFSGRVAGFSCETPEAEASPSALWPRTRGDRPWEYSVACLCVTLAGSFPPWACASVKCVVGGEGLGFTRPLGFSKRVSSILAVNSIRRGRGGWTPLCFCPGAESWCSPASLSAVVSFLVRQEIG